MGKQGHAKHCEASWAERASDVDGIFLHILRRVPFEESYNLRIRWTGGGKKGRLDFLSPATLLVMFLLASLV